LDTSVAAKNALKCVLEAKANERLVVVCDEEKTKIGEAFTKGGLDLGLWTRLVVLEKQKEPRASIPKHLGDVLAQKPDIFINILSGNREETPFRIQIIRKETADHKSRLGHCPGITEDILTDGALALTPEEHANMQARADHLMDVLKDAVAVNVCSKLGTDFTLSAKGRPFFTDTKLDWETMKWMNLPTGEVLVAPVEDSLNGKLVCDMAVGGMGKLRKPVEVTAKDGKVTDVFCEDKEHLERIKKTFQMDSWSDVVGEFAFGINPKARFVDAFVEAEKMLGTVHVAFGANTDMVGGKNPSKNHMDMMISEPTVVVTKQNGQIVKILDNGVFQT
jgi:aminopeptidase